MKKKTSFLGRILFTYRNRTVTRRDGLVVILSLLVLCLAWWNFSTIQEVIEDIANAITQTKEEKETITIGEEEWEDIGDIVYTMSEEEIEDKKQLVIGNVCVLTTRNLEDLYALLSRADICSEAWFIEYEAYSQRLQEQNQRLEGQTSSNHMEAKRLQEELIIAMAIFYEDPRIENVEGLEEAVRNYQEFPIQTCQGEMIDAE